MKSGFAGLIGRPNVGKSTLLNAILGEKAAIVTDKPQTTRNRIRGIYTREDLDLQMVFIDTPGIHKPRNKLDEYMVKAASGTLEEVDVILFIIDRSIDSGTGDKYILECLNKVKTPKILVINKIDRLEPELYLKIFSEYETMGLFDRILGTCAKTGKNVQEVIEAAAGFAREGPMYFSADMVTDYPQRFMICEIVREKLLMYMEQEIPHGVAVEIEKYEEREKSTKINVVIYCEKKSHKGMIIGKNGHKLKGVGKETRLELEALLGRKVYLELWVKVKEHWRDNGPFLSGLGYDS